MQENDRDVLGVLLVTPVVELSVVLSQRGNYAMRAAGKEDVKRESFTRICNQVVEHSYRDNWTASLTLNGLVSRHLNDVDFEVSSIVMPLPLMKSLLLRTVVGKERSGCRLGLRPSRFPMPFLTLTSSSPCQDRCDPAAGPPPWDTRRHDYH